jgi:hypothetical protein
LGSPNLSIDALSPIIPSFAEISGYFWTNIISPIIDDTNIKKMNVAGKILDFLIFRLSTHKVASKCFIAGLLSLQ